MGSQQNHLLSRRHFCLCCMTGAAFAKIGDWLTPRQAFAEARGLVSLIKDSAASSPVTSYTLRGNVSVIDYSTGGNIDGMIAASDANLAVTTEKPSIPRDMLADIRDKVAALKEAGRTLPETVAAKPTADHDTKFGQFVIDPAFFTKLVYEGV
jgi:hypothetical protein